MIKTAYPQSQIEFWIPQAYNQLNAIRLGLSLDLAAMLFVAHNVALSARAAKTSGSGGLVGDTASPISSKSIGGVSYSYDTSDASIAGAGEWNATSYGQRLYKMFKAFGTGPAYIPGGRRRVFGGYAGRPF